MWTYCKHRDHITPFAPNPRRRRFENVIGDSAVLMSVIKANQVSITFGILLVNRNIYAEALPVLYAVNHFRYQTRSFPWSLSRFIKEAGPTTLHLDKIRNLTITVGESSKCVDEMKYVSDELKSRGCLFKDLRISMAGYTEIESMQARRLLNVLEKLSSNTKRLEISFNLFSGSSGSHLKQGRLSWELDARSKWRCLKSARTKLPPTSSDQPPRASNHRIIAPSVGQFAMATQKFLTDGTPEERRKLESDAMRGYSISEGHTIWVLEQWWRWDRGFVRRTVLRWWLEVEKYMMVYQGLSGNPGLKQLAASPFFYEFTYPPIVSLGVSIAFHWYIKPDLTFESPWDMPDQVLKANKKTLWPAKSPRRSDMSSFVHL